MAAPATIFFGNNSLNLPSGGVVLKDTSLLRNDGEKNYVKNGHFDVNVAGWTGYDDASQVPVDGTGGVFDSTFTRITATPLAGRAHGRLAKDAANRRGEGIAYDIVIDDVDQFKTIFFKANLNFSTGTITDGDFTFYVYDVDNGQLITPSVVDIPAAGGTFISSFSSTDSSNYRLLVHIQTTDASAMNLDIVEVFCGPGFAILGGIPIEHEVRVKVGNGHGSTNNKIRRFTTIDSDLGNAITYVDSATDGASFTINEGGLYAMSYQDRHVAVQTEIGISLNSSELTTAINAILTADRLVGGISPANATVPSVVFKHLNPGDIIRPHTDGIPTGSGTREYFQIVKVDTPNTAPIAQLPISDWLDDGPITLTGVTVDPTKGTIVQDTIKWRQVGDSMEFSIEYEQSAGGANGTGTYLIEIPRGETADSTKLGTIDSDDGTPIVGQGTMGDPPSTSLDFNVKVYMHDTTHMAISIQNTISDFVPWSSTNLGLNALTRLSAKGSIPIQGWSSNLIGVIPESSGKVTYLKYQVSSGTAGGGSTASVYAQRPINTANDPDGLVTLAADQFSFSAVGEYAMDVIAMVDTGGGNARTRVQNVTAVSTAIQGFSFDLDGAVASNEDVGCADRFTVTSTTDLYEIQTIHQNSRTDGLGIAISLGGDEVYLSAKITKL